MTLSSSSCSYCPASSQIHIRSSLARAVLNKIENDRCLQQIDRRHWYRLSNPNLLNDEYRKLFEEFNEDTETNAFIKQSQEKSDCLPLQILQSFLTALLTLFMTRTSGTKIKINITYFSYSQE